VAQGEFFLANIATERDRPLSPTGHNGGYSALACR
jgi:hypothetical protein